MHLKSVRKADTQQKAKKHMPQKVTWINFCLKALFKFIIWIHNKQDLMLQNLNPANICYAFLLITSIFTGLHSKARSFSSKDGGYNRDAPISLYTMVNHTDGSSTDNSFYSSQAAHKF